MNLRTTTWVRLCGLCTWFVTGTSVLGQQPSAAEERSQAFQAVQGPVTEDIAGGPLLLITYAIIWLAVFLYVHRLHGLSRKTQQELARIEQLLGAHQTASVSDGD